MRPTHPTNATKRPHGLIRGLALVVMLSFAVLGCDHATDPEGPGLVDLFGPFELRAPLGASTETVDFAGGESVVFTAEFSKRVNWVIEITGQESGAVKRLEGFTSELSADIQSARWRGGTTELPLFKDEIVEAALFVPEEDSDTTRVTLEVLTPRLYPGNIVTDFEEDSGTDILLGNFEFEFDLQDTGLSAEVPPAQGDFFYLLRSTGGPTVADPFFIGLIAITNSDESYLAVPTTNPENLYFNAFLHSFGTPNTIAVVQLGIDSNGNGTYEPTGGDASISIIDQPVDWEGWQAFGIPVSEVGITQEQVSQLIAVRVLLISDNSGQPNPPLPVDFGIDYITFTSGGPLEP